MLRDKQLSSVSLDEVVEKRRLAQALNAKEFAVLAGVSYATARDWLRLPGFPAFRGVVFWQDFERWRAVQTGLSDLEAGGSKLQEKAQSVAARTVGLPPQAARIVAEFG
jgi:hypothetical protein